jgi:hypothetical protein
MERKRRAAKEPTNGEAKKVVKTAVNLSPKAHKILSVAAVESGKGRSRILNDLILEVYRGYYIGRRAPGETGEDIAAA